jgi:hypothetical protein
LVSDIFEQERKGSVVREGKGGLGVELDVNEIVGGVDWIV